MNAPKRSLLITTLAIALATGLFSSSAFAQDTTGGSTAGSATTGTNDTARTINDNDDDGMDLGWLGLLGLAGLAGLRKKPDHIVHERTTTPTSGPNTGVR